MDQHTIKDKTKVNILHLANNQSLGKLGTSDIPFETSEYFYTYTIIIFVLIVITLARSISFYKMCMAASNKLYNTIYSRMFNAVFSFFDTKSCGTILQVLSNDVKSVDESLPNFLADIVQVSGQMHTHGNCQCFYFRLIKFSSSERLVLLV